MANQEENKKGLLAYLSDNSLYSFYGLLVNAGLNGVLIYISPSPTMRIFMTVGAVIGLLFGYGLAFASGKNVAKNKRVGWAKISFFVAVLIFISIMFANWVLNPDVAREYAWVESLREQLIAPSTWANTSMCILAGGGSFFIMYAFVVLSPNLDKHVTRKK